jgi:hypothetical protein
MIARFTYALYIKAQITKARKITSHYWEAIKAFVRISPRVPPDGEMGDILLGMNCILTYRDKKGFPKCALNPLVHTYLKEVELI